MTLVWVALGGALGSASRYGIGVWISQRRGYKYPFGTFTVNVTGAFLFGVVLASGLEGSANALLADGFLGGFTTFSTFMYEGVALIKDNETKNALLYVTLTMVLGIGAFALGWLTRLYL
jgi:CrcB protein